MSWRLHIALEQYAAQHLRISANEDVWDRKHHAKGIEQFVDTQVDLVTEAMHMSNSFTG